MSLDYTVNWIEKGRTPSESSQEKKRDLMETQWRDVTTTMTLPGGTIRTWMAHQCRSRQGVETTTTVVTSEQINYTAHTVTQGGVTSAITREQSAAILADCYTQTGILSASTAQAGGPTFTVSKTVKGSSLKGSTNKETTWDSWSDWQPTMS